MSCWEELFSTYFISLFGNQAYTLSMLRGEESLHLFSPWITSVCLRSNIGPLEHFVPTLLTIQFDISLPLGWSWYWKNSCLACTVYMENNCCLALRSPGMAAGLAPTRWRESLGAQVPAPSERPLVCRTNRPDLREFWLEDLEEISLDERFRCIMFWICTQNRWFLYCLLFSPKVC